MKPQVRKTGLLTVQDVATHLAVSPRTVYRLMKDYRLPAYRIGGQWRFKLEAIEAWMGEADVQLTEAEFKATPIETKPAPGSRQQGGGLESRRAVSAGGGNGMTRAVETIL
jgi:excisionase family DNA binding protein